MKSGDEAAISRAVEFVALESLGMWHNRARAKLARHFKNHAPDAEQQTQMVDAIVDRLKTGRYYEQFKDQLAMAVRFRPNGLLLAADVAIKSDRSYIQKYAKWVQNRVGWQLKAH